MDKGQEEVPAGPKGSWSLGLKVPSGPGCRTPQVGKAEVSETGKEAVVSRLSSQDCPPVGGQQELAKAASSVQSFLSPPLSLSVA